MNNKRFGCLSIGLLVLLVLSVLVNAVLFFAVSTKIAGHGILPPEPPKFDENVVVAGKAGGDQKIALIHLRGIISSFEPGMLTETAIDDLKLQLKQAADDSKIKAIVVSIDSPGGEVTASDILYNAVREVRERKPVVVYMGSVAASGGYYVACGGSWLIANDTTFTGSIGVIMQALNYQDLFGKVGLQMRTFKSGKFKDMLSGSRPITDEEQEYIQNLIMQTYGKFVGIVAKERNLPEDQLRNGIADGRVLSGKDALGAKLIDQLGNVEQAYAKAMELGNATGATVIRYDAGFKFSRLFRLLGQSEKAKIEIDLAKSLAPKLETGRLYFLPSFYAP
jgi:protease-4